MKRSALFIIILIASIFGFIIYSLQVDDETDQSYTDYVLEERSKKETYLKSGAGSPFVTDSIPYTAPVYFPVDKKYNIRANLKEIEKKKVVTLGTNDGKEQRYLEYGYAQFTLDGTKNNLLVLEVMDMGPQRGKLFLAFADATSGFDTYGAGRYLDVKKVRAATTIGLDFNLAYNPYCAYSEKYSCPFPPKENLLSVAIEAGEKTYH